MSARRKTTVGVVFGGRSVEHDVSIVTAQQIMNAFDAERYEVVPIYIDRSGAWFTGDPLRDVRNFQNEVASLKDVVPTLLSPHTQHHGLILDPLPGGMFKRVRSGASMSLSRRFTARMAKTARCKACSS